MQNLRVMKRDGSVVDWDAEKIFIAVGKAFAECGGESEIVLEEVTDIVCDKIGHGHHAIGIEEIQDAVESALMDLDFHEVAKAYILYRNDHQKKRDSISKTKPDKSAIADYIHLSKYAKYLPELARRETYLETVDRVRRMHCLRFPEFADIIEEAFKMVESKYCLPSMRSMQFAGQAVTDHNARMYNCCYTLIDRPEVFGQALYLLLCGCGVGYSVQLQHIARLPRLTHVDVHRVMHHSVEDSIEGWADALTELVKSYIHGHNVEFSFNRIRHRGSALKSSGGKAPGHVAFKKALDNIRIVLNGAQGRHLKSIECHDIMCFASEAVLAGGIRRSSMIALFNYEDEDMRYAKDSSNFSYGNDGKNYQRALANNSVAFLRDNGCGDTKQQFFDIMAQNKKSFGEPGFVFLDNLNHGVNPCGEIGLDPVHDGQTGFAFCNLTEVNVAACRSIDEFNDACHAAAIIGTLQASYTSFPYLGVVSEMIAKRDALLGVSLTGIMDNPEIGLEPSVLNHGATLVRGVNENFAKMIGILPAKRCTCVKPSGTASLELGCVGSGIHAHHSHRYFRRVTASPLEPVAQYFRMKNQHMVEEMPNGDWSIVFPIETSENAVTIKDQNGLQQLNAVSNLYRNWVIPGTSEESSTHHNVSCTISLHDYELDVVLRELWQHNHCFKALTFLIKSSDKKIPFCPRESVETDVDIAKWNMLIENYTHVDWTAIVEDDDNTTRQMSAACSGGLCEIDQASESYKVDGQVFRTCDNDILNGKIIYDDRVYTVINRTGEYLIAVLDN